MSDVQKQVDLKINGEQAKSTISQMEKSVRTLNAELKRLPEGTDAFNKKAKELGQAQNQLEATRQKVKELRNEQSQLAKIAGGALGEMKKMGPIGGMIDGLTKGFKGAVTGVGTLAKGFFTLSGAIAATGIGALVIALGALFAWFTKTDEGATKLDGIMRALGATLDVLMNRLINIGDTLKQLFTNPMKFFQDLKTDIEGAVVAGMELAEVFDELDQRRRDVELGAATAEKTIAQLMLQSKNISLSYQARLKLLDEASKLEKANFEANLAYHKDMVKAIERENALAEKQGTITDEQLDKLNQARIKLIQMETESISMQEKIENRRAQFIEKQEAERTKQAEEARKKREEIAKKEAEAKQKAIDAAFAYERKVTDLQNQLIPNEFDRKLAILQTNYDREREELLKNKQLTEEMSRALDAKFEQERAAIEEERKAKALQQAEKDRQEQERIAKEQKQAQLDLDKLEQDELQFKYEQKLLAERQFLDSMNQLQQAAYDRQLNDLVAAGKTETLEFRKIKLEKEKAAAAYSEKVIELGKRTQIQDLQTQQAMLGQSADLIGGLASLLEQDEANRQKHAEKIKMLRSFEVLMSGFEEVAKIWLYANSNPLNAVIPGWGAAFAVAQTGLATARTSFALNKINAAQFEKGGVFGGSRHSAGGNLVIDSMTGAPIAEVESGEPYMILSRQTYANNKPIIDALLDASIYRNGARVKFESGGVMGGQVPEVGQGQPGSDATNQLVQAMIGRMDMLIMKFDQFPKNLKATVEYEQSRDVDDDARDIEMESMAA